MCVCAGVGKWADLTVYCVAPKDKQVFHFRAWKQVVAVGGGLGVYCAGNTASARLSAAQPKSFNPFGVESPAGAATSLHLLALSL